MSAYKVSAPHFEARVGFARRTCRTAESPLKFLMGWSVAKVRRYCERHGWRIVMLALLLSGCGQNHPPVAVIDKCAALVSPSDHTEDGVKARYNCRISAALTVLRERTVQCWDLDTATARSDCGDKAEAKYREASIAAEREAGRIP